MDTSLSTINFASLLNESTINFNKLKLIENDFEEKDFVSVNDYLLMSAKKTGSLFELCFEIATLVSDKYEDHVKDLKDLGRNLGIIFQIQDDILEIFSNTKSMGKSLGSDILSKKIHY